MTEVRYYAEASGAAPSGAEQSRGTFGMVNWVGAGCSLALVAGLITWSVQLTLRDVTEVPVIAALSEPMRVAPEDPGGMQAAYQGLSVNEIKAGGAAAPAADRVVLAPPPVALEPVTNVMHTSAAAPIEAPTETTTAALAEAPVQTPYAGIPQIPVEAPDTDAETYAAFNVASLVSELDNTAPQQDAQPNVAVVPASVPGVALSARPMPRPAATPGARATGVAVQRTALDVDPGAVTPGARLVQLGAFDTPDQALEAWDTLENRFGDYMQGKQRLVQSAVSGGRNFYRLRVVGFEDATAARQFCSAFLARNTACIPVTAK